jgi:hypothetical protein
VKHVDSRLFLPFKKGWLITDIYLLIASTIVMRIKLHTERIRNLPLAATKGCCIGLVKGQVVHLHAMKAQREVNMYPHALSLGPG